MQNMAGDLQTENQRILNLLNRIAYVYGNKFEALENRMEHLEKMIEENAQKEIGILE